jgi:hypothetical protein
MMYDIYFDPAHAKWRMRMVYPLLIFFSTTREVLEVAEDGHTGRPLVFDTFPDAQAYAVRVGLTKAYTMRYPKKVPTMTEVINGAENYAHQSSVLIGRDPRGL